MIFEQGERPGHLLPDAWHDERHLSRAHLLVFLTEQGNSAMAEAAIIPRPDSKTRQTDRQVVLYFSNNTQNTFALLCSETGLR